MNSRRLIAAAIADDLTGAQEIGALLAARGLQTAVMLQPRPCPPGTEAVVYDTETRHLSPVASAGRIDDTARLLPTHLSPARIFKKVDSTMRGNVAVELSVLSAALGDVPVRFTPAYPAMGRTVVAGELLINGTPVAQTPFGQDPLCPVHDSRVPGALDAVTDLDLEHIANTTDHLLAGSAGLGRIWASHLPHGTHAPTTRRAARPLLICGSAHPVSRAQLRRARQLGIPTLASPEVAASPETVSAVLAREAVDAIRIAGSDLLILFGGETAFRVLKLLNVAFLSPVREVAPGIVVSTTGFDGREMMVVTKAGGFGAPEDVDRIMEQLT